MRNGSGTYIAPTNSWNPATNGQLATSGDWQALLNDIVAALTQSVSRDGQTPITGNLQMGNNKITGLSDGTGTGQAVSFAQLFNQGTEQDLASAATTDIGAQLTNFLRITGTTTITSFGTNYKGPRFLRFEGAVTLTNSSTLILPGGANITTAAGDCCIAIPKATLGTADGWQVVAYQKNATGGIADNSITTAKIAANAVTYAKMQNVTTGKVLGRDTSGTGVVQELPIAVDSSGNVGIGTSSPSFSGSSRKALTLNAPTGQLSIFELGVNGALAGYLYSNASQTSLTSVGATPLLFETNGAERARIDSSGNLLVGTTSSEGRLVSQSPNNAPTIYAYNTNASFSNDNLRLKTDRAAGGNAFLQLAVFSSSTLVAFIRDNGNLANVNNSYGAISDIKLKENIVDATPKLEKLNQVRVVNYNLIGDTQKQIGVVAQELEQIFPGMVEESQDYEEVTTTDEDGNEKTERVPTGTTTKAVKYSVFVPMLIKAIQEQQVMIEQLKADVAALKGAA